MTGKVRVYNAIQRKPIDRLPRFIWVGKGAAENLSRAYGIKVEDADAFVGNDVLQTWLSINRQMNTDCEEGKQFVDEWGITWQRDGAYNAVVRHPMADFDATQILEYDFPDPYAKERYAEL